MVWATGGRLLEDAAVLADGGRLAYVGVAETAPAADEEISGDWFLMPGVVDRHVHIALADPGAVLAGGVTAVRDLGWVPDDIFSLAEASESPSFEGPLVRAVGPIITCRDGYPSNRPWAPPGTAHEVTGADEAAAAARRALDRSGVPAVKVALNTDAGPTLTDEELLSVCQAAHEREAIVTAHVQGKGQTERAVGAGVDELAHAPWTERLSEDVLGGMAGRVRMVSTLDIHSYGKDTPELRRATDNVARFLGAGGTVTYGTDLGNGPIPPGIHVGEAFHLGNAGLSAEGILQALTFRPLAPGEPADVVGLAGNPLEDLAALGRVRFVMHLGRVARLD